MRGLFSFVVVVGAVAAGGTLAPSHARGDATEGPFVVRDSLSGEFLGRFVSILEDEGGRLGIDDVSSPPFASSFRRVPGGASSFGYTTTPYWVRLDVRNPSAREREWLVEADYPPMDYVDLYAPRNGSFEVHRAGDQRAYIERDVPARTFVFRLTVPPASTQSVYLRFKASGTMTLPLYAWTYEEFLKHQNREQLMLFVSFGMMLVMGLFNLALYFMVREREHLHYVVYIAAYAATVYQYITPNEAFFSDRYTPASIGACVFFASIFERSYLDFRTTVPKLDRFARLGISVMGVLIVYALFGPYTVSIRLIVASGFLLTIFFAGVAFYLMLRGNRAAKLYNLAWGAHAVGAVLVVFKAVGYLPESLLTTWGVHLGAAVGVTMLGLGLAERINATKARVYELNARLSSKIGDLRRALDRAEEAAVAKGNFLATVSHELRTPLNAIINIPQGLLSDFPEKHTATCGTCATMFALEEGEPFDPATACPECGAAGALAESHQPLYVGSASRTATFLGYVEQSGKSLLQVVNGILDFSRIEAGRETLEIRPVDLVALLRNEARTLAERAAERGLRLALEGLPENAAIEADPVHVARVVGHLVGNAIKFSERGTISLSVVEEADAYVLQVRDEGVGIAAEDRERIFRSFEQAYQGDTRRFGGTGLGLSISKSLVEMHGGAIWVESELGRGSTFFVRLRKTFRATPSTAAPALGVPAAIACVLAFATLFAAPVALADDGRGDVPRPFELTERLEGEPLGRRLDVLRDPSGTLRIDDVAGPRARDFAASEDDAPSYGFVDGACWARLRVRNPAPSSQRWFLEVANPLIDYVDLYVEQPDGSYEVHRTGDRRPFDSRDVEHRTFVFDLEAPGGTMQTLHLRMSTSGAMSFPIQAWTPYELLRRENEELPFVASLFGMMLAMCAYNLFLFFVARDREYLLWAGHVASYLLFQLALTGYAFQYLAPRHVGVANRILPLAVGLAFVFAAALQRRYLRLPEVSPRGDRAVTYALAWMAAVTAFSTLGDPATAIRWTLASTAAMVPVLGGVALYTLAKGHRAAKFVVSAWALHALAAAPWLLRTMGIGPAQLTHWGMHVGPVLGVGVLSLGLADRINFMRANVEGLNEKLAVNAEDLGAALAKAQEAARAKSNFLATVSHELRTPLNAIINIPQGLLRDFPKKRTATCRACRAVFELEATEEVGDGEPCPECGDARGLALAEDHIYAGAPRRTTTFLGYVESAGQHLLQLVDGILDFSGLDVARTDLTFQRTDAGALLREVAEPFVELAAGKGVELVVEPAPADAFVEVDRLRFRQVVINLLGNAIKFSGAGGRVTVGLTDEGDTLVLRVADRGVGIAPEDARRIFQKFEQVRHDDEGKQPGTGLGLSISKTLVEMHGGAIWVESELGHGSTFFVRLPRRQSAVGAPSETPGAAVSSSVGPDSMTSAGAPRGSAS